jgi:hypothetical protein
MDAVDREVEIRSLIRELGTATRHRSSTSMYLKEAQGNHNVACQEVDRIKDEIAKIDPGFDFSKPGLYK